MPLTIAPRDPIGQPNHIGTLAALEATVMILLGHVAALGTDSPEEANGNLAVIRGHCQQVRETLLSMVAHSGSFDPDEFDDAFTRELDRIFEALSFTVNKPQ